MHAFAWLPRTLYGGFCPVQSPYDLHALAPGTPSGASKAYEINRTLLPGPTFPIPAAQIAGQAGGAEGDAFVWTLAGGAVTITNLNSFSHPPDIIQARVARSIADGNTPAVVVGAALADGECNPGGQPVETMIAFHAKLDGSNQLAALVLPMDNFDTSSAARDVNFAPQPPPGQGVGPFPDIAGYSDDELCIEHITCESTNDALVWENSALPAMSLAKILHANGNPVGGAKALGINDAGDLVGYSFDEPSNPTQCIRNATLWTAPNQGLVVLGDQPPLTANEATLANAINNASLRQIVGMNESTNTARLWEQAPGGGWQPVLNLDTAACDCIPPTPGAPSAFVLREALDINDSGWIVARGQVFPGGSEHAYLLRRVSDCPADLNGDGQVNAADLAILNGNLGLCASDPQDLCCDCLGNLDGDGGNGVYDVDRFDHMILVGAYGPCPGFGPPCAPEGGAAGFSIEQGVQVLGFAGVSDYQSWLPAQSEPQAQVTGLVLVVLTE
jgi:hypothetical protein